MWKKWRLLGQITGQLQIIVLEKMKMIGRFEVLCSRHTRPPRKQSKRTQEMRAQEMQAHQNFKFKFTHALPK
jgi:hypothetical protein